jgi:hypothetical protein
MPTDPTCFRIGLFFFRGDPDAARQPQPETPFGIGQAVFL